MADYKSKHTGAAIDAGIDKANAAILTQTQSLADDLKQIARTNIGAASQAQVDTLSEDIDGLKAEAETVPSYVISEAESVIDKIASAQGNRTFVLAAITDIHYGNGSYTDGAKHATQALKYIDERIKLDAVAVLGDFTDGFVGREGQYANAIADFKNVNTVLNGLRFCPNLRIHGNHDYYEGHMPEILRYTNAYSDDVVWGNSNGSYFYRDFDRCKLRIICLNTVGNDSGQIGYSDEQAQWFADTLNLSEKENAANWNILILSHQPVDFIHISGHQYKLGAIIDAYVKGTSYASVDVNCDFTGKNTAKMVGNIHGHIHNLLVDRIYVGATSAGKQTEALRIATPEACYGRANGYSGVWHEEISYPKTKNTANDTSFVVYCIDLDTDTIKAICYGAGYDRTITFGDTLSWEADVEDEGGGDAGGDSGDDEEVLEGVNQIPIATDANGNVVTDGAMYNPGRWDGDGNVTAEEGYFISGYIPAKVGDMLRIRWPGGGNLDYIQVRAFKSDKTPISKSCVRAGWLNDPDRNDTINESIFIQSEGYALNADIGILDFTIPNDNYVMTADTAYITVSLYGNPSYCAVTINEPID